jgi:hypothetical protein
MRTPALTFATANPACGRPGTVMAWRSCGAVGKASAASACVGISRGADWCGHPSGAASREQ